MILCTVIGEGGSGGALSVAAIMQFPSHQQKLALRSWIADAGFALPNAKKIESILDNVLTADWDRFPLVRWGDVELRRHRDDLYLMAALNEHDVSQRFEWHLKQPFVLPYVGMFTREHYIGMEIPAHIQVVEVRFRQDGEMLALSGRGRQSLKNLLQKWNIAPWLRDRLPLIYCAEKLYGVLLSNPVKN